MSKVKVRKGQPVRYYDTHCSSLTPNDTHFSLIYSKLD